MDKRSILDVGQCGVDGPRIGRLLCDKLDCDVEQRDSLDDALNCLRDRDYDLCLVKRELAREGTSGLDLIKAAKDAGVRTPIMLVSDRSDAQAQAQELGAIPGFGKSKLYDERTVEILRKALSL